MKNILLTFLLFPGLFLNAQQQDLIDNDWYLTMITIEGEDFLTPPSDTHTVMGEQTSLNYHTVFTGGESFYTEGCNYFDIIMQNLNDTTFTVTDMGITLEECMYPQYAAHDGRLYNFLGGSMGENFPWEGFMYEIITNSDGSKSLEITNPDGDIAIYNNQILSVQDLNENNNSFQVAFQNDNLIIQSNDTKAQSISIYDLSGKQLLNAKILNGKLNTNGLSSGIYLIQITDEKGNLFNKKVRKP